MNAETCDACAAAERNPLSGQARDGCRACLVRQLARAPRSERERVYAVTQPEHLAELVADVRAAFARARGACGVETTFTRAGADG